MKLSIKLLSLFLIIGTAAYAADTASILPPAKTTFFDQNGKPLTSGKVDFYIPNTTTRKATWQDAGETILNLNPVILDSAGRALILGSGSYRQVVKDRNNNIIWDQVTSSTGSGGNTPSLAGDGAAVGTIHEWAGMTAPSQYVFTYGQEISRATFSAAFAAITSTQAVFCTSGSPIITGLSDTTNFPIGAPVELSCVAAGFSTVVSKTSTTLTLAANANVTVNINSVIFPWGRGNGTTTFNVPDFRGLVPAGNNNMGGTASANLTAIYFGSNDPNSIGASGGSQSKTLLTSNLPAYTPTGTNSAISVTSTSTTVLQSAGAPDNFTSVAGSTTFDNVTRSSITSSGAAPAFTGVAQGGTSTPFSLIQPTKTINYVIKITPDVSISTSSVVTSLGGMTGDITCGSGITCAGNTISSTTTAVTAGSTIVNGGPGILQNALDGGPLISSNIIDSLVGIRGNLFVGPGGTGVVPSAVIMNGSSGSAGGSALTFTKNAIAKWVLGDESYINANSGTGFELYSFGSGTAVIKADYTTGIVTLGSPLPLSSGGTNNALTASNGGVVYSDASKLNILAGTVTAGQCLLSGSSSAPTWGSCAGPVASVSSVSDSGSGTLTISPTTGNVLAAINLTNANTWTNTINEVVTDPQLAIFVDTFLDGGDIPVTNKVANSIYSTLTSSSALSPQLGPAFIVQQIVGSGVTGSGAAGAIVGGVQNDRNGNDGYAILGIVNNTASVTTPTSTGAWGLIRGTRAGSNGIGFVDGLRSTSEVCVSGSLCASQAVTITLANPAVISLTSHGLIAGDQVAFIANGDVLPATITAGLLSVYFVSSTGLTTNTFQISATPGGASISTLGLSQSGTHLLLSPQEPRAGVFIGNSTIANPYLAGTYVQSALQYGFRMGSGGTGTEIYEPLYPFAYVRRGGAQPFYVDQSGGVIGDSFSLLNIANSVTWAAPATNAGVDFGAGTNITRRSSDGHMRLNSQNGIFELINGAAACNLSPTAGSLVTSCSSDDFLKSDIVNTKSMLSWLDSFTIKDYTIKSTGKKATGYPVSFALKKHPEMVHEIEENRHTVDAPDPWKMLKVMQDLHKEIKNLKAKANL